MGREPVAVRSRISGKVRGMDKQDEDTRPRSYACVISPHFHLLSLIPFLRRM